MVLASCTAAWRPLILRGMTDIAGAGDNAAVPFALQGGEGRTLETPTGGHVHIKADAANTNGSLSVMEITQPPGQGPALHTHSRDDEVWYVLEGEFRFRAGDEMFRLSPGGMAFGPRGTPHCFQNIGQGHGRLLVITAPAGLEHFFEQFAALPPGAMDLEALAAAGRTAGVEFVGPPLALSDPL
jgi:mannose-6-phosphate isomerase-like protein (cupin superfamily)